MNKGITVCLSGANVEDVARRLVARIIELGHGAEWVDEATVKRLGGPKRAAHVCHLLARNGVVVVATRARLRPEGDSLKTEASALDTPDFAAEKILDELAARGVLRIEAASYSQEDEELIRQRLANLGYIE